jgi:hypothetical protein
LSFQIEVKILASLRATQLRLPLSVLTFR